MVCNILSLCKDILTLATKLSSILLPAVGTLSANDEEGVV